MIRQLEKENTELTNKIDNLEYDMVRLREEGKQKGQDKSLTFELSEGSILHWKNNDLFIFQKIINLFKSILYI